MSTDFIKRTLPAIEVPRCMQPFDNGSNKWKRLRKFKLNNGKVCRYFYLANTPLIAVVTEDKTERRFDIRFPIGCEEDAFAEKDDYVCAMSLLDDVIDDDLEENIEAAFEYSGKQLFPELFCIDVNLSGDNFESGMVCITSKLIAPTLSDQHWPEVADDFWPEGIEMYPSMESVFEMVDESISSEELQKRLLAHGFEKMSCQV